MTGQSIKRKTLKKPKALREGRLGRTHREYPILPPEPISKAAEQTRLERELIDAAKSGKIEKAKELLKKKVDVNTKTDTGWTPLMYAAARGDKEMAKLLIRKGADVNARNGIGATPLMYAAAGGHVETVELLIRKGADVHAVNHFEGTALSMSRANARPNAKEVSGILIENGAKRQKSKAAQAWFYG